MDKFYSSAQYPGRCRVCGELVHKGTPVYYDTELPYGRKVKHAKCDGPVRDLDDTDRHRWSGRGRKPQGTRGTSRPGAPGGSSSQGPGGQAGQGSDSSADGSQDSQNGADSSRDASGAAGAGGQDGQGSQGQADTSGSPDGQGQGQKGQQEDSDSQGNPKAKAPGETDQPKPLPRIPNEHERLPILIALVSPDAEGKRSHVWVWGPKGTGKSHAASVAAKHLGLKFYSMSVGRQTIQQDFFGYYFHNGVLLKPAFREWFEHGGLFCIDEIDAASAEVLTSLNSALSNKWALFPDGMVLMHPNSVLVATANTEGRGKTEEYSGRSAQDGALLDRFHRLLWPIDLRIENKLTPNKRWLSFVRACRKALDGMGEVSMRASVEGSRELSKGIPWEMVVAGRITSGLSPEAQDIVARIEVPQVTP